MDSNFSEIDIYAEKLTFQEFCNKIRFLIPEEFKSYVIMFEELEVPFIVNNELLTLIGYTGDFRAKNQHFKDLLNDAAQKIEENRQTIPYDIVKIQSADFVKISFTNFIKAVMKMRTDKAIKIREFLGDFIIVKQKYIQYLLKKYEVDQNSEMNRLRNDNELALTQHKMIIMQKEHEIQLLQNTKELLQINVESLRNGKTIAELERNVAQKDLEIVVLKKDMEIIQKSTKITALEKNVSNLKRNIEKLLPNAVTPPSSVNKRQRFCLIDDGNNIEGKVFRRQGYSMEKAKDNYLLSHENGEILLEVLYSANSIYFFNNIREYAKEELSDKVSIVNNTIKVISPTYNLDMFVQDLLDRFSDEFEHYSYIIYRN